MVQSKVNQLQLLQQNMQVIIDQKQLLQNQLAEIDSALDGLKNSEKAYKIVGHIMIAHPAPALSSSLAEKKEILALRFKHFTAQEEKLKRDLEVLQKEAVKELGSKKNE